MELNRLRPQLDGIAIWIGENRSNLQQAANSLLSQKDTTRIGCSEGSDPYVRVRLGDGRFIEGHESQIKAWSGDFEELVGKQRGLLRKAGCQGYTWDNDGFLKLFLRPNVFVAIPDPNDKARQRWIDHYRNWAEKGSDPRGDFCRHLPGDWFLCTERR